MAIDAPIAVPEQADTRPRRHLKPTLLVGSIVVAVVVVTAAVSFVWTPYDPTATTTDRLLPPGGAHLLGTDALGRDVFSQLLVGARTTLFVGVVAVAVAAVIGVPLGLIAGQARRGISEAVMRFIDLMLAFPALLLAIVFGAVFGSSTLTAMIAIGIGTAPAFARLTNSGTMQVMASEYILAARVAGRGRWFTIVRHVLPNIGGLLIVQGSVVYGIAVLAESGLSYLGFGTAPPTPSWGRMLQEAQPVLFSNGLLSLWPAAAIAIAVLGFNLLGDGLRDHFDPRLDDRR
jgi:peptide/nickel transport system permease protein